jgi:hypothetical protein
LKVRFNGNFTALNFNQVIIELYRRIKMAKSPIGTTAKTGEKCPESGVWEVVGNPSTTAPIAIGNTMPPYRGQAVTWKLIKYA